MVVIALFFLLLPYSNLHAFTVGLTPSFQTVPVGNPVSVDLYVSGLGNGTPPSLGTFDLNILFDSTILYFNNATFGDPGLGDQLDLFGLGSITSVDDSVPGVLNLFELSLDMPGDLDLFQADSFTLATLTFDTLTTGTSSLSLTINALGDSAGNALSANIQNASVAPVPEPSTAILLAISSLAGMGYFRQRK